MINPKMNQKPVAGIGIAAIVAALCLAALASDSAQTEKPAAVDAEQYADFIENEVFDIQDLAEGAEIQRRMFNRITPQGVSWVQPMFPPVVPFDAENFDEKFLNELLGEDKNSVAIYPLSLTLDPKTRETLVYNAEGKLIAIIPADRIFREWPEDADPARVTLQLDFLPAEDVEPYLYTESRIADYAETLTTKATKSGGMVLRSLGASEFGIARVQRLTNGSVRITVTNGTDVAEVYSYTVWHTSTITTNEWVDEYGVTNITTNTLWSPVSPPFNGIESEWECLTTNLVLSGGVGVYEDANISSNARVRFYSVANRLDSDGDGISDGWEIFYGLDPSTPTDANMDPDEDGFSNIEEYMSLTDPTTPISHPGNCWYVATNGVDTGDGSYANPLATLTNAFAQAEDGDRVILLPGIHNGAGNRNLNLTTSYAKRYFLTGLQGHRESTIVDCEYSGAFAQIISIDVVIRHLTVCNAISAGIRNITSSGNLTLIDCIFSSNNTATIGFSGNQAIFNCVFTGHTNHAISCSGPLSVEDSIFVANMASNTGGAVYMSGTATSLFTRCIFSNNLSGAEGGAIYGNGAITAEGCRFVGNQATNSGGGVYAGSGAPSSFIQCIFSNNTSGTSGGAILSPSAFLENCLFNNNHAQYGGALYASFINPIGKANLNNCTFTGNTSDGAAIQYGFPSQISLVNCIVWSNVPSGIVVYTNPVMVTATNCFIQGTIQPPGINNSNSDPLLAYDGWHLSSNSPCRDAGVIINNMRSQVDVDGKQRIKYCMIDIGADEYGEVHYVAIGSTNPLAPYLSWATAANNIQQAISACAPEGLVLVSNGIYSAGSVNSGGGAPCRVALTNRIHVKSVNGAYFTTILGNGPRGIDAVRCAYVGSNSILQGFTLSSGHTCTDGTTIFQDGGGAWCEEYGQLIYCLVTNCSASNGGGVYGGNIQNCRLVGNTAHFGGGIYGGTASHSTFSENLAMADGGAAYEGFLYNSVLRNNSAVANGGGTFGGTTRSCLIISNSANTGGGTCLSIINNSTICDNSAEQAGGAYGGNLLNSIVYFNNGSNWVGGIFTNCCTIPIPSGLNNITNYPLFTGRSTGDYSLQSEWLGIDAGVVAPWMLQSRSLNGVARVCGVAPDMGAYELSAYRATCQVIDRSVSMLDGRWFEPAKKDANTMIDGLGSCSIGIVAFAETAMIAWPVDALENETDKSALKTSVDALQGASATCIRCGLDAAVAQLNPFESIVDKSIVLWTDDYSDYSLTNVPLNCRISGVATSNNWHPEYLSWCAQRRLGSFWAKATPIGLLGYSGVPLIACEMTNISVNSTNWHRVVIDSSDYTIKFRLLQNSSNSPIANFSIYRPNGTVVGTNDSGVTYSTYSSGRVYAVSYPTIGIWTVKVSSASAVTGYVFAAQSCGGEDARFVIDGARYTTSSIVPIRLLTSMEASEVIVVATNVWGVESKNITLFDDGRHNDEAVGDGLYGASMIGLASNQNWRLQAVVCGKRANGADFRRLAEQSIYISGDPKLSMPTNCGASQNLTNAILLSWAAPSNAWCEVQRSNYSNLWCEPKLIASLTNSSYSDTNIVMGVPYYYRIRTFQPGYCDSEFSSVLTGYSPAQ